MCAVRHYTVRCLPPCDTHLLILIFPLNLASVLGFDENCAEGAIHGSGADICLVAVLSQHVSQNPEI